MAPVPDQVLLLPINPSPKNGDFGALLPALPDSCSTPYDGPQRSSLRDVTVELLKTLDPLIRGRNSGFPSDQITEQLRPFYRVFTENKSSFYAQLTELKKNSGEFSPKDAFEHMFKKLEHILKKPVDKNEFIYFIAQVCQLVSAFDAASLRISPAIPIKSGD